MDLSFWAGRRVLVTGHTGFKGAWLSLALLEAGAEVSGYALAPEAPSLFDALELGKDINSVIGDVRDEAAISKAISDADPEVLLHLAAQPLVRHSYAQPVQTYATNIMGTVHVLEAARTAAPDLRVALVVTSDKCYDNHGQHDGYREEQALGGDDPYSSSKGAAELVTAAYRASYFSAPDGPRVATARAGNVIGGGDWAQDRLIPDLVRAATAGEPLRVRNPEAIRPWQHVLNCVDGYLLLARRLHDEPALAGAWNFGPSEPDARSVGWIADRLCERWGDGATWTRDPGPHPPEAATLRLDSTKARDRLGWRPRWDLAEALDRVVAWHRGVLDDPSAARALTLRDLRAFAA